MIYKFDLVCPRCGRESEINAEHRDPPPKVNCGDCLMDDVEIVEFKVVRIGKVVIDVRTGKPVTFATVAERFEGKR